MRQRTRGRIVGGNDADIQKHPYQLAMFVSQWFYCGGCIINEQWAVTAAHCLEDYPITYTVTFRAGSTMRDSGGQENTVMHYEIHEDYDDYLLSYDIAIVHFYDRWDFGNPNIRAIPLASADFEEVHGSDAWVSGWGYINNGGTLPQHLQEVSIPLVSRERCELDWDDWLHPTMICAGGILGRDSCGGDSGGPLVQDGELIGLVSWGDNRCGSQYAGVYTRIGHYGILTWIHERTGHHLN